MDTVISSNSIRQLLQHSNSKWVTRERPKIDRIACPWLIRRFIDPRAEFLTCLGPGTRGRESRAGDPL